MAHCNTIFPQMLKPIPRPHWGKLETEPGTGRQARSFTRWRRLVHLLSIQLTARVSLRGGVSSLKAPSIVFRSYLKYCEAVFSLPLEGEFWGPRDIIFTAILRGFMTSR